MVAVAQENKIVGASGVTGSTWGSIGAFYPGLCLIANWFFSFLLVFAVLMILYSGFLFITNNGDSARVSKARSMLLWGLLGLAIAFLARALVFIVGNLVGATASGLGCP